MNAITLGFDIPGFKSLDANGHLILYAEHGAAWRYDTLLQKEPETIEWIDTFQPGETLWDIGANVGIYSVYAGVKGVRCFAFEPHFANYHQFCFTVAINGLQDVVTPLCLAFSDRKSIAELNLASLEVGTSMSNFGAALDFRGQPFQPAFRQGMIGYDIDSFIDDFGAEVPDHIKIDVDGIELAIVAGAERTLANPKVKSVSIELIESDNAQVDAVMALMEQAGLQFVHKKQNLAFATPDTTDVLNFLFHRDPAGFQALLEERQEKKEAAQAPKEADREDGPVTSDELAGRIARRIRAAEIDAVPSANIFIEDMLPQHVYTELLARLPGDSALDPIDHPQAIADDGRRTRYLLDLTPDSLPRLDPEDRPFWEAMIAVFTAPEIADAMIAKFEPELRARFGEAMPELVAVPILYRDYPGYRIGIHPDTPKKIATLQFYLPEDESQIHLGTSFHRRTPGGFERHKTNSFKPNSAYAFVRTEESWHSVDELDACEKVRNTIALTFYIKGQEYRSDPDRMVSEQEIVCSGAYDAEMQAALRSLATTFNHAGEISSLFRAEGTGVELGVGGGDLSEQILSRSQIAHLYSIAPWAGEHGGDGNQYRSAIVKLSAHRHRNSIVRMNGEEAQDLFSENSLDFIYVSSFAGDRMRDRQMLASWFTKLRSGGIVAGYHQHAPDSATSAAVKDFAAAHRLEIHSLEPKNDSDSSGAAWFAMKP
ncbi:MAG: FkbM family methyltransferase [Sphingomonas sp.]|nr:FkbM family methyltransferase [Sphingomonas sp.]